MTQTVLLAHGGPTQNSDDKGYLGLNLRGWILMRDLWCDVTRGDNGVKMASFYNPVAKLYGEF